MAAYQRPSNRFLASMLLLLVTPLATLWTAPLFGINWWEWWEKLRETPPPELHIIERIDPSDPLHRERYAETLREHLAQYQFAVDYSREHNLQSVADIASGTCYGMEMLRQVVSVVDGYDKEDFCGNYVLDLDREDWNRKYDAIVSFETIEHLANPEFFLENAVRSAPVLLLSAPVNETPGRNHFHLQHWGDEELQELLERYYTCEYWTRVGDYYEPGFTGGFDLFAVCTRPTEQVPVPRED